MAKSKGKNKDKPEVEETEASFEGREIFEEKEEPLAEEQDALKKLPSKFHKFL